MVVIKLRNGWVVDTSTFYSKQGLIQIAKYTAAFSFGSLLTSILLWNWTQKLLGINFMQLIFKIILKRYEMAHRKAKTWRTGQLSSKYNDTSIDEKEENIVLTRPSTQAVMMDNIMYKTFNDAPKPLLKRIAELKKNSLVPFFASAFPSKTCISEYFIYSKNKKKLKVNQYNWPGSTNDNGAIIHFHGGAFIAGENGVYDHYAAILSQLTGMSVYCVEWGVAPDYLHPCGVEDVIDAYEYILNKNDNLTADKIYLSGDSAGGCIVLLAIQALASDANKNGLAQPYGAILSSPVCDMSMSNKYYEINKQSDCIISKRRFYDVFRYSVGYIDKNGHEKVNKINSEIRMKDGLLSPLYGNFKGIKTKLYFWVSRNECMYGEVKETIGKCKENNIDVQYEYNQWLWHDAMPTSPLVVPEARDSCVLLVNWIKTHRKTV